MAAIIGHGHRLLIYAGVFAVADHADDGLLEVAGTQHMAQWIGVGQKFLHEGLIHHGDGLRLFDVRIREIAAGQNRNSHRAKKIGTDIVGAKRSRPAAARHPA